MHSTSGEGGSPNRARKRNSTAADPVERSSHGNGAHGLQPSLTTPPRSSPQKVIEAQATLGRILRQAYEAGALNHHPIARRAVARGIADANGEGGDRQIYRAAIQSWLAVKHPLMFPTHADHDSLTVLQQACKVIGHRLQVSAESGVPTILHEIEALATGL